MKTIGSYVLGRWSDAGHVVAELMNPATEESLGGVTGDRVEGAATLAFAREQGGPALGALTFAERGELLRKLSRAIHTHRDELIALAVANGGNTRGDAKFDIDGASGTLAHYADLGQALGDKRVLADGEAVQLGRSPRFAGQHILVPRAGVALFVNAFNFPAWGIAEKAACALLAGMPIVAKPATATALVAHRMVELWDGILPAGALQLILGPVGDLLEHLGGHDVLAFTGSSATAAKLRGHAGLVAANVHVNVEADSLNAAVLAPDVEPGSPTWDIFIADVVRDMTQKAGQKCTAIRRVFVAETLREQARDALAERLGAVKVGDPAQDGTGMGPVATAAQRDDVRAGIARLAQEAHAVIGGDGATGLERGYFVAPVLFEQDKPHEAHALHEHEVFGPVATLAGFDGPAAAVDLVRRGGGGLVASVYSDDRAWLGEVIPRLATHHGRIYLGSAKIAGQTAGPGTALPQLLHGGPGRAGGGEELGGVRGMLLYQQRTALEGDRAILDLIAGKG